MSWRRLRLKPCLCLRSGALVLLGALSAAAEDPPTEPAAPLPAAPSLSVIDLQPFRQTSSAPTRDEAGRTGMADLVDLNPGIHAWYLLQVTWQDGGQSRFHLETAGSPLPRLELDPETPGMAVLVDDRSRQPCPLWPGRLRGLAAAGGVRQPYTSLCDGRLYLRSPTPGHKSAKEWATDFLRDYVPGGESITTFVRGFYKDTFATTGELSPYGVLLRPRPPDAPARPEIDPELAGHVLPAPDLALGVEGGEAGLLVGRWYPTAVPGVFVSVVQPRLVAPEVVQREGTRTNRLDEVELSATVFMVAFDLQRFELGFSVGTDHPRVDWSDRAQPAVRDQALPGPDGIGDVAPLVRTGMLNPTTAARTVATFTGGFKRSHSAFKKGALAQVRGGSHYGFVESGVVLSRLHPGLATAVIFDDGHLDMLTWTAGDDTSLARIRHARQNGVPLVEPDPATGRTRVGELVRTVSLGNWSGSVDGRYRTVRGGIGLQDVAGRRFLLYGYFSAATASAMARVFDAYRCRYAMMTDINALEHTYMALYHRPGAGTLAVEHLVRGMDVLDKQAGGQVVPRFLGYADNRDFFYLCRKEG